ncbi:MAG: GYDIA family GHMP kinase, partial [Bacteroidota bacterium]
MTQEFYSHGKLLITGEYVVLDGVTALAIPTKKGQYLRATPIEKKVIQWRSILADGSTWFTAEFTLPLLQRRINDPIKKRLLAILLAIQDLNAELFAQGWEFEASLEFDRSWGLGSSSTLINNLADWAQVDPFELLDKTFGGSGYDIACAQTDTPLLYKLKPEGPSWKSIIFNPPFKDELFFVYLNKKQNSRESIQHYRSQQTQEVNNTISKISAITKKVIHTSTIIEFEGLLET